ncbi:MAG: hypothetical protein PWQ92_802 [Thermococcaceae archaeon]|nr:hypothetical protein [Thermococcaceae archaeon]
MQRWVVLFVVGVLFLSSFAFAGQFQGVGDSQVLVSSGTCSACSSCQGFDVDKALREINLKIENLTRLINQKEAELHKLYAELNKTKSVETLEKIVKLEDEIQLLKSEKAFYERRKNDLIILSISYIARPYRQFKNNEINVYIKELEQAGISMQSGQMDIVGGVLPLMNRPLSTLLKNKWRIGL